MAVRRITANLRTDDPPGARDFWSRLLGLDVAMDMGWIATLQGGAAPVQLQVMSEGGSGTDVPAMSVEVDDLDAVLDRARTLGAEIAYGPVDEPWGVRRFYIRRDGVLVNILSHVDRPDAATA